MTAPKTTAIATAVAVATAPSVAKEQIEQLLWLGGAVGQLFEKQQDPGEVKKIGQDDPG